MGLGCLLGAEGWLKPGGDQGSCCCLTNKDRPLPHYLRSSRETICVRPEAALPECSGRPSDGAQQVEAGTGLILSSLGLYLQVQTGRLGERFSTRPMFLGKLWAQQWQLWRLGHLVWKPQ